MLTTQHLLGGHQTEMHIFGHQQTRVLLAALIIKVLNWELPKCPSTKDGETYCVYPSNGRLYSKEDAGVATTRVNLRKLNESNGHKRVRMCDSMWFHLHTAQKQATLILVLDVVLVRSGCYTTTPPTGWIKQQTFFSQLWRLGSPRLRHCQIQCLLRTCFLVHRWCLLSVSSHDRGDKGALWGLVHRGVSSS